MSLNTNVSKCGWKIKEIYQGVPTHPLFFNALGKRSLNLHTHFIQYRLHIQKLDELTAEISVSNGGILQIMDENGIMVDRCKDKLLFSRSYKLYLYPNDDITQFTIFTLDSIMDTDTLLIVKCPHCGQHIEIVEINCAIFRHGVLKDSGTQIDPHSSEEMCNKYVEENLIYGCGKPFAIVKNSDNGEFYAEKCDYI